MFLLRFRGLAVVGFVLELIEPSIQPHMYPNFRAFATVVFIILSCHDLDE